MIDNAGRRHQKNYRRLLRAISRPGRLVHLEIMEVESALAAALSVAECLVDAEVSHCVIGAGDARTLQASISSATGAQVEALESADFVFVAGASSLGGVHVAKRGSPECPEEGATLVYCIAPQPIDGAERFRVRLTGPGISEAAGIAPEMAGIPVAEFRDLATVNADYPLGIDAFFIRPSGEVMGLPRSTRIRVR